MKLTKLPTLEEIAGIAKTSTSKAEAWKRAKGFSPKLPTADQAPSTQRILSRPREEDEIAKNRVVSTKGQTTTSSTMKEVDSKVVARPLSAQEVNVEESMRRKAHDNTFDESEASAVDEAKKRVVKDAFKGN